MKTCLILIDIQNDITIQASTVHASFMAALSSTYATVLTAEQVLQAS